MLHTQLTAPIRKHARHLRRYLEGLGRTTIEEPASRRGRRLDIPQVKAAVLRRSPNMLIHSREEFSADLYLGVLIDRSGSMCGEKIRKAKAFGALIAESAKGLGSIEGQVNAFDEDTFYRLGNLEHSAVATLQSGGSNNDAGGLSQAAELAIRGGKNNKLIIMISDGLPTDCTFESLKKLVELLTRNHGIVCAQVAVDNIKHVAFPHFVDLSRYTMDEAVAGFGRMIIKLTITWR